MKIYQLNDIQGKESMPKGDFLLVGDYGYEGKFVDGKLHCENGPARTWLNGTKEWYENGDMHRLDGPAMIGREAVWWAVRGFFITCYEDYQEATGCSDADIITLKLKWGKMQHPNTRLKDKMYVHGWWQRESYHLRTVKQV